MQLIDFPNGFYYTGFVQGRFRSLHGLREKHYYITHYGCQFKSRCHLSYSFLTVYCLLAILQDERGVTSTTWLSFEDVKALCMLCRKGRRNGFLCPFACQVQRVFVGTGIHATMSAKKRLQTFTADDSLANYAGGSSGQVNDGRWQQSFRLTPINDEVDFIAKTFPYRGCG